MNAIELIRPKEPLLPGEVSFNYFRDRTRSLKRVLSGMSLESTLYGTLKLHAQTYAFALGLEADARSATSDGPERTYWRKEVVRWQKVIFSSKLENWNPFLDEISIEIDKFESKPSLTQEESELKAALTILHTRISLGK